MTTPLGSDHRAEAPAPAPADPDRPALADRVRARALRVNPFDLVAMLIPTVVLAVMAWRQRWMTDDGLIFTRVVRQILDGNGPLYNIGERTETSTSTLWQWVLVVAHFPSPFSDAVTAVYLGMALMLAGLWLAMAGTRRFYRTLDAGRFLLPAGALVFVAIPTVWDFSTAGMETGLIVFWLGASWLLLVSAWDRRPEDIGWRRLLLTAVVYGLGPTIRPDLGLAMVAFLAGLGFVARVTWKRGIAMVLAAGALPAAYEIFRMGYYGVIFPMPAMTKEASDSAWGRGWDYLTDYSRPYYLWIPLILIVVLSAYTALRDKQAVRTRVVAAVPIAAALMQTLYILNVGGDFMHGRMWMPVTLLLVQPVLLVPFTRYSVALVAAISAWALVCGITLRSPIITTPAKIPGPYAQVWNERDFYKDSTGTYNPVSQKDHLDGPIKATYEQILQAKAEGKRLLFFDPKYIPQPPLPLRPDVKFPVGLVIGQLGVGGAAVPLDGIVADVWGLSQPIGARIEETQHIASGHRKLLPVAWTVAMYVDPSGWAQVDPKYTSQDEIRAAAHVLQCGPVKELMESVSAPMSLDRFWKNFTGAYDRTKLRIPSNPIEAEKKFC
ncbi:hypothetical protein [Yinghuangia seranimata]|uniref:hypothetical protein n=1 Tax=Yinghuangia seranimata TaxID=408067 RepID=UPI00248CF3F3|nr:hypothetical protein [Yinghuangia seranimata]MDI2126682.1 hypothetical protein [Yinghuangia seranimata]